MFLKVIFVLFVFLGFYNIVCDFCLVPSSKTSKAIISIGKSSKPASKKDVLINDLVTLISKKIKLNTYRKENLVAKLYSANVSDTPEIFIAKALVKPIFILIFTVLLFFITPIFSILTLGLAAVYFFKEFQNLDQKIETKKEKIELELNQFTSHISKTLQHNNDVLSILENYVRYAGKEFGDELKITVADMRSGNYETALRRMAIRINSTAFSDISRGLISVIQGDNSKEYFQMLTVKFAELTRQTLLKKADRIPSKVNKCIILIVASFLIMVVVIMISSAFGNIGSLNL